MAAKKKAAKKAPAKKKKAAKRKPNAAFMKAMKPSAALGAVIGNNAMPRTEVTKKIWAYIKKHGLQDSKNRRNINADDALKAVFGGKKQVSMFEMTKLVNKHLS
jgi:chromatin remodeling complex protein RSC6